MADDDRLDELIDRWQALFEAGRAVSPAELCQDCPELAPALEQEVAVLHQFHDLAAADRPGADTASYADPANPTPAPERPGDPDPSDPEPIPAAVGGYQVVRVLGAGGMGRVFEVEDPVLGRRVALKVMRAHVAAQTGARERFLREARSAAALQHDHVVPIHHVGEDRGTPFLVMPLLPGESLESRLKREGALSPAAVARIGREAAAGLAAAHAVGLVHRDVKPGNLWLEAPGGRVKVLDFGLARATDGSDALTSTGALVGTPGYMAPEQVEGRPVDARADLFSLGAVLYHAATGTPAFRGSSWVSVIHAVVSHHPPQPHTVNPAIPVPLSGLIMRLLAKDVVGRPESAAEVADELDAMTPGAASAAYGPTAKGRPIRRYRWPVAVAAPVLLLGVGVAIWQGTRNAVPETRPDTTKSQPQQEQGSPGIETGPAPPRKPVKYRGSVDLYVYRKDDNNSDRLFPLWDPRAMPLRPGDQVKLVAEVDPPGFLYVFWIDETGAAVPAYPWQFGKWGTRPAVEEPVSERDIKWPGGEALKIEGPNAGTETILMLVRPTKLTATDAEVQRWFAGLPPVAFEGDKARVWFEDYDVLRHDRERAPGMVNLNAADGPRGLQAELRRRIGDEVGFSRAVSFSRMGAK